MKKRANVKAHSLPMTITIAIATTIVLLMIFCAASASLILNGTLKNTDLKIIARIIVAVSAFVGVKIAMRNNSIYVSSVIFAICLVIFMISSSIVLKIKISNLIAVMPFILLGTGTGLLSKNIKPKKRHFSKKRYR